MKIFNLICFFLIVSSCSRLDPISPDYIPKEQLKEVFQNNQKLLTDNYEYNLKKVLFPQDKYLNKIFDYRSIKRFAKIEKDTIYLSNNKYFVYSKSKKIYFYNIDNLEMAISLSIDIAKEEKIYFITEINNEIYLLTNRAKLFKLVDNQFILLINFDLFLNKNIFKNDNKILAFSVFGSLLEIDPIKSTLNYKGNFNVNDGYASLFSINSYSDSYQTLYNSGTAVFINKNDNMLFDNYYIEDLNILTSNYQFKEFLDTPFYYNNYLYFIDIDGMISVFNPISSEFLWEVNLNSSILDYLFDENGYLLILTDDKFILFDSKGNLKIEHSHEIDKPLNFWKDEINLYISKSDTIEIFEINTFDKLDSIKTKINGSPKFFSAYNNHFLIDDFNIFILSE